ncbi:MAG: glycosyltransferase family 4 protein [Actinomycetota bacterium]
MSPGRALVISPRLPEFDRESGLLRVSHLIDMLLRRGWKVTFGCLRTPTDPERYAYELEQRGVETHAPLKSIDSISDVSEFRLAILAFWHVAEKFIPELREAAPSARLVVDSIDLHFVREMRDQLRFEPGSPPGQLDADQAETLMKEINTYAAADAVLTVSEKEAALINDLTAQPRLAMSLPDAEELPRSPVPLRDRRGILFLGNFLHAPNCDAAEYLCQEIIPRLDRSLLEEHPLSIVGTAAEEHVRNLAGGLAPVKTVGWVPSVLPYLNAARVSVVPLRYGAGTKRKIVQALMVGTPTVTTPVGAEGLGVQDGRQVLIADDSYAFARAIERLLRRPLTWWGLARRGRRHMLGLHGRAVIEARFDLMLEDVLARPVRPAASEEAVEDRGDGVARSPEYAELVAQVREAVESDVPAGAKVLVATRGDDGFLAFEGRTGWHFPRNSDGRYAGHYPADSEAAIAHLEELREKGATHLALPETAFWWMNHYEELNGHLEASYPRIRSDEQVIIWELSGERPSVPAEPESQQAGEAAGRSDGAAPDERGEEPRPEAIPVEVTPELIQRLQPAALPAASRHRVAARGRRALVLGVYLTGKPNTAEHVAATLAEARAVEVSQRWVALGEAPADGDLGAVTTLAVSEATPKYALLNRLLADEDLESYDFVITTDDDIVLPEGFLDLFLGIQTSAGYSLAQPARTHNSFVDHPIVLQQRGVLARQTLFVEIGPMVSFGRDIYELVFPFDESNPMGWGFENVWARLLYERGKQEGIVDAVPVDHSIRPPVAHYTWSDANAARDRYLARHPHFPYEDCFRVFDVVAVDR